MCSLHLRIVSAGWCG
ncbi:TPA: hypothetical protein ACHYY3_004937 [Escherichia coli]|nr:hypothetical protein [Escherichia coli]MEB8046276.1 hypothetical protein [Escherichia coli]